VTDAGQPAAGTVHVHEIALDAPWHGALALLDAIERGRAARLRFEQHRRRFTVAHAALRTILARYLGRAPLALGFATGEHGKPVLEDEADHGIAFNLSHAHERAVVAVARARRVGVDLERLDGRRDTPRLVQRYFSTAEQAALATLSGDRARRAFFDCWVRKEAYLKARGAGLTRSLGSFSVSVGPGDDPVRIIEEEFPDPHAHWWARPLDVAAGYTAAVVASGGPFEITYFRFGAGDDG